MPFDQCSAMDITESHYLKVHRCFMSLVGQWPTMGKRSGVILQIITSSLLSSSIITQVAKIIVEKAAVSTILEVLPMLCAVSTALIKFYNYGHNAHKIRILMKRVKSDWRMLENEEESSIMHRYAAEARFYAIGYAGCISCVGIVFSLMPFLPMLLDEFFPLNETRTRIYVYEADYLVNKDEYQFLILTHMWFVAFAIVTTYVSMDTMFIFYVQHACGIFTVSGYRLQYAINELLLSDKKYSGGRMRRIYKKMSLSIQHHKKSSVFAGLIESSYVHSFFFLLGTDIICLSCTLIQISKLLGKSKEVITYIIFAIGQLFHLLCMTFPGQKLTDHADDILFKTYNGLWYIAPIEVQKLLVIVMRRCLNPCLLTGGGVFVLSIENFAMVIKTSVSYFTFLSAMN